MTSISEKLGIIRTKFPEHVTLVAVSKTKPSSAIQEAYDAGQRIFGENRVQEMAEKHDELPKDIEWHMIGHLQSNKVKYMASFVSLVHGVDSLKLLQEINNQAQKNDRIIDCLLQFHIASESTKFGLHEKEAHELLSSSDYAQMKNIRVRGVMGMSTFTEDDDLILKEMGSLKDISDRLKVEFFNADGMFDTISMGMSGDYGLAIKQGSTMIRLGSSIFGKR
ncbi:MAG: pyridoxal phosphate enzyme (YggS family) [Flavobacteriales bacterium]|jgi:pyridoxal phosphate enzyme (YggS family)